MNKISLQAEKRTLSGRKVKQLRKQGVLPANIYGKKIDSISIQTNLKEFLKVFKYAGETGLVELSVNNAKKPVLIHNVQLEPVSGLPIHVDFLQVDLKQKVSAGVPIELINEAPAEKQGLGTVVQYINEIEVEALPADLPEKFEIDLSNLTEVEQSVLVKNLKIDSDKIEIKVDPENIILKVEPPRKEEEVAPPVEAEVPSEEGAEATGEKIEGSEESIEVPQESKENS